MARVLLIEPNISLAKTYVQALTHAGHDVQFAADAQGGIHCADQTTPDVVVLEIQLAAHSGIEFLHEFRSYAEWQEIPVIINSFIPPQDFVLGTEALREQLGVCALHYKPQASLQTLLRSVAEYSTGGQQS